MSISTNTDHEKRKTEVKVRCQECESETIPEGLYCMNCGHIPDWRSSNGRGLGQLGYDPDRRDSSR